MDSSQATRLLIEKLRRDASLHEQGSYSKVGCDFDEFDAAIPRPIADANFWTAFTFWDSWLDQCGHGFGQNFYRGISCADWPQLAREIANNLESATDISNALVLEQFCLAYAARLPKMSLWSRLQSWLESLSRDV